MCNIVGIAPGAVKSDSNAGGAQYLIKNVNAGFWKKIESDSENIYIYLSKFSRENDFPELNPDEGIQAWCADMWAFWWNALLCKKQFRIHPFLEFCWANSPVEKWNKSYILHYTGDIKRKNTPYFRKGDFCFHEPFFEDLSFISEESCSYPLLRLIYQYKNELNCKRLQMTDVSFVVSLATESAASCSNLYITLNYLSKHIDTFFIIAETGSRQFVETWKLPLNSTYIFRAADKINPDGKEPGRKILDVLKTKYAVLYDADLVVSIAQLEKSMEWLRRNASLPVFPYDQEIRETDILTKTLFSRILDSDLLLQNIGKIRPAEKEFSGNVLFCKKEMISTDACYPLIASILNSNRKSALTNLKTHKIPGFAFKLFRRENKPAY